MASRPASVKFWPRPPPLPPPNLSSEHPSSPHEAQRAADLAAAESVTEGDSAQPPEQKPTLPSKHPRADNKPTSPASQATPTKAHDAAPTSTATPRAVASTSAAPKQKTPRASTISLLPPAYCISRSATNNLPIYTGYKRGGNLLQTTIRKVTGDASELRDELRLFLNKKDEHVTVNSLTNHVLVKGHHKTEIAAFLKERGF